MTEANKRKVYVFVVFIMMCAFESIPDTPAPLIDNPRFHDFFLLYDVNITWQTYFYCLGFQVGFMMLLYLIWMLDQDNRVFMRGAFIMTVLYVLEYILHYSSTWYRTEYFDFSSHLVTVAYLGLLLNKDE